MNIKTTQNSPLEGLLICGECRLRMIQEAGPDGSIRYRCRTFEPHQDSQCPSHQVDATYLDGILLKEVLKAILTNRLQDRLISQLDQHNAQAASIFPHLGHPEEITRREIRDMLDCPEEFVRAILGPAACRQFLGTFIKHIEVHQGQAVINYRLKLPADSDLAGQNSQVVRIPGQPNT